MFKTKKQPFLELFLLNSRHLAWPDPLCRTPSADAWKQKNKDLKIFEISIIHGNNLIRSNFPALADFRRCAMSHHIFFALKLFDPKKDRLSQIAFFKKSLDQQFCTRKGMFKTKKPISTKSGWILVQ